MMPGVRVSPPGSKAQQGPFTGGTPGSVKHGLERMGVKDLADSRCCGVLIKEHLVLFNRAGRLGPGNGRERGAKSYCSQVRYRQLPYRE
jgi:hypothetical protein